MCTQVTAPSISIGRTSRPRERSLLKRATMPQLPDPFPLQPKQPNSAEEIVRNFYQALRIYEVSLPADQKAVLYVNAGEGERLRIDRVQWHNPTTVYCIQDAQNKETPAQIVIQHVSQFEVFMTYEKRVKQEKQPGTVLGFGQGI
jgi:hypothetical protein